MREFVLVVGLDEAEATSIAARLDQPVIAHAILSKIIVKDGQLWSELPNSPRMIPASKVIFQRIFEDDFDFMAGLALWGGACLPNPRALMDCRLKLPCLVRALQYTHFGSPSRGYPYTHFESDVERVATWGNWHGGEHKDRFTGTWTGENASVIDYFLKGQAVRVVMIGDQAWQIKLVGDSWLKSAQHAAAFMALDSGLLEDTRAIRDGFGLEIVGNDYMVGDDVTNHLLEVNHSPNVTRFPELWDAYLI